MVTDCETSLSFLALNGFVATKIEVFNHDTQEYETISLIDEEATAVSFRTETLTNEEIDEINLLLYTKEGFMISNEAYHKLSMSQRNYEKLAESLADIRKDVNSLQQISLGTQSFEVEWFLGGDWKFLACVCGLGAAIATHPCIWCKCQLYDKYDKRKEWSLVDITKGARTIQEIDQMSRGRARADQRYNVKKPPLFPSIPLDHVIIDSLHLFLRISDNLINLLILELRRMDEIEKKQTFNNGFERTKFKHMAGWESFLNDTLKIPFNWFICKETKKLKWRDLTGPEKMKLFRNIDFTQILPNHSKSADIFTVVDTIYGHNRHAEFI
ncbi:hypothetical protein OS493_019369 [Desmophyllum pertusum]|uniref:Uncharacterized protein n=1 Tax=Desmophyllum pertusum TaxID=174260 RepID=A0A9X0A1P4_9CNID|nr:hypothetical protein OS493_019369 [Desmophyllum pertusum]